MFKRLIITKVIISTFAILCSQSIPSDIRDKLNSIGISADKAKEIINQNKLNELNVIKDQSVDNNSKIIDSMNEDINNIYNNDAVVISNDVGDKGNLNVDVIDKNIEPVEEEQIKKNNSINASTNTTSNIEYFGYNIFKNNPDIFQLSTDIAVRSDYEIGPNDEIIIMLWGDTEEVNNLTVSRDGFIFIPRVGQVFVNGLTLDKLEKKLAKLLGKVYSSIIQNSGRKASTFFDVSIGSIALRPTRLFVLGEVNQPGAYNIKSSSSLFSSLFYFNGPKISGSLRDIRLIRNDKEIASIDFYNYLIEGKKVDDVKILNDDIIFIPNRKKTITVFGEISREAIYELKDDENLKSLIKIAGGIKPTTYVKRIQIDRILPASERSSLDMDRTFIDVNFEEILSSKIDFDLVDGDRIQFFSISENRENFVNVVGAVTRPGIYDLGEGMTVSELMIKVDGITGDTFLDRVEITRQNSDFSQSQYVVNIGNILNGLMEYDFNLQSQDEIRFFSKSEMLYKNSVFIEGHVENPGKYAFKNGMTLSDLIFKGGGFNNREHLENTYFEKSVLTRIDSNMVSAERIYFRLDSVLVGNGISKLELRMGDKVKIFSKEEVHGALNDSVSIRGHVKNPGKYKLSKNMNLRELLFLAGGFEDSLHLSSTFLERLDLIRTDSKNRNKKIISFNLAQVLDSTNNDKILLEPEDEIICYSNSMFLFNPMVEINGPVVSPGFYNLKEKMSVQDLILEAGGIIDKIDFYKIDIASFSNSGEVYLKSIDVFNSEKNYTKSASNDLKIKLKPNDNVTIRTSKGNIHRYVIVEGEVIYPGSFVLVNDDDTVYDVIKRAGGITEMANPRASRLKRSGSEIKVSFNKILNSRRNKTNFKLFDGDSIIIGKISNTVEVKGAVNSPGSFPIAKNERFKYYVDISGGYNKDAAKFSSYVTHADGTSEKISIFDQNPKVYDGSIITVVKKEEVEPFSFTQYVTNLTSVYTDIIQGIALIRILQQ